MQNTLLVGLSRQVALGRELDVVANNIANINTTGFKAEGSIFEEFLNSNARADQTGNRVSFVRDRGTWHDLSSGPVEKTGNPLDMAIDGKGFLVVQTPAGERYTRNGSFQINNSGELVTSEGYQVLGEAGPMKFQPTDNQVSISADGTISVREGAAKTDSQRGRLRMVSLDAANVQKDGNSTFSVVSGTPAPTTTSRLMQGFVEKSNVRAVVEMTRMIEVTRSYTQVATMLSQQADLQRTSMSKLAEVPN
jgi:flagellar basal-body rod protein FlgF